jgi:hypothetical protein
LLRKAAARSAETICVTIGKILRAFTPTECANHFRNSGYLKASCALVFVRLAHDRRFVGSLLFVFVFVLVLFVFIRISGRHRVAHDHERTPVDQPGGKFLGDVWGHVVAPRVWKVTDLCAVSAAIQMPGDSNRYALHVRAFAPEEGIRIRSDVDHVPYVLWRDQGFLTATPGDTVDLSVVEAAIREMCELFDVQEIAFDRWSARQMMDSLAEDGLPVVEFPQNPATFAQPVAPRVRRL